MPRKRRLWSPGSCYHIILRGIDGREIFKENSDRCRFCLLLQEATELHKFRVHAFCLMSNHIHLLLEPLNDALAIGVHRFSMRYAQYFNQRYQKCGYVFQGRFKSILVENGSYMRCLVRYIHLNPLEAGLADIPTDYFWSSYNAYFGRAYFTWLETERVLSYFDTTRATALTKFAQFMSDKRNFLEDLDAIKQASRLGVYGSHDFTKSFLVARKADSKSKNEVCSIETLMTTLCAHFNISKNQLTSAEKTRQTVDARTIFARTAQLLPGLSLGDVTRILGKHHGTISRLASRCTKCPKLQEIAEEIVRRFS